MEGVDFYEDNLGYGNFNSYHNIKFNNYINKSHPEIFFSKDTAQDIFNFGINSTVPFGHLSVLLSDSYLNVLDWSEFVLGFGNGEIGEHYIDFTKSVEHKLEEPYNDCKLIDDETYRQTNCLAHCQNRRAIAKYNCTLRSYYYSPGYDYCDLDISEFGSACQKHCPKECKTTKFDAIVNNYESTSSPNDTVAFSKVELLEYLTEIYFVFYY